jgi:DNA (cytosine-5)-methyltransferase 1
LFENVPMIVSETFRDGFDDVFRQIADLGYENILLKLNAKHYGIPQNRDRIFVLSIRKGYEANYSKPKPIDLKLRLKDMLEDEVDASFYLSDKMMEYMTSTDNRNGFVRNDKFNPHDKSSEYAFSITTNAGNRPTDNFIQEPLIAYPITDMHYDGFKELSPTLKARDYKDPKWVAIPEANQKGYAEAHEGDGVYIDRPHQKRGTVQKGMIQTLSTTPHTDVGVVTNDLHIRKLTPRETWRLMGFDDSDFDKASAIHSNSTLYKQAGNSIVVNVLEHILKGLFYEPDTV